MAFGPHVHGPTAGNARPKTVFGHRQGTNIDEVDGHALVAEHNENRRVVGYSTDSDLMADYKPARIVGIALLGKLKPPLSPSVVIRIRVTPGLRRKRARPTYERWLRQHVELLPDGSWGRRVEVAHEKPRRLESLTNHRQ